MPAVNDKVMDMVRRELDKNSDISNDELYQKAVKLDSSVSELSSRQFNARYPLQVKRGSTASGGAVRRAAAKPAEEKAGRGRPRGRPKKIQGDGTVRSVLLELIRDVTAAESKPDLITVISNLDTYEDKITTAAAASSSE